MTIGPPTNAELTDALAWLGIDAGVRLVARGEIDPLNILVARRDGHLVGAVYAEALPGRLGVIQPARAIDDETSDVLHRAALDRLSGVRVVQAFLPEGDHDPALERVGFRRVTTVREMRRSTTVPLTAPVRLDFTRDHPALDETLVRCHVDSLDCPELNERSEPADLVTSFGESAWLAIRDGQPVGVLSIASGAITFLGVVPEHRGQGVGKAILAFGLTGNPDLSLLVDDRNLPALRLYRSAGFETVGAREVHLLFPP